MSLVIWVLFVLSFLSVVTCQAGFKSYYKMIHRSIMIQQNDVSAEHEKEKSVETKEQDALGIAHKYDIDDDKPEEAVGEGSQTDENPMPSQQQEEQVIKKKYGGLLPRKPPLISKDHERAFFDSADWALGKQKGQKPKGPLEALRPKLQPTHQQTRSRRSYASTSDSEGDGNDNITSDEQIGTMDVKNESAIASEDSVRHE